MQPFIFWLLTDKEGPLLESRELLQSMQRINAECLNEACEVIHGKRQVLAGRLGEGQQDALWQQRDSGAY